MNKEIITEKIFIDSSVFIKENFFAGIKLIALIKHAQEKKIELFTTEITLGECLSNIEKQFLQGKNLLLKTLKTLASNARILKNVEDVNEILEIGENLDSNKELAKLKEDFKELISKNFKVIPIDASKTQKIIDDYFSENPPFKGGSKKHEFPDAIVLNSLDSWCTKQKERIYNITTDEDMLSYVSKRIIPICEYDQLLNLISYTYSEENIVKKVEESLNTHSKDIIEEVEKEFENNFPSSGWDSNFGYEYYLNSFEDLNTEYINHSILSIYDNKV